MTETKIVTSQGTYTTDKPETLDEQIRRLRLALSTIRNLTYAWDEHGAQRVVSETRKLAEAALSK